MALESFLEFKKISAKLENLDSGKDNVVIEFRRKPSNKVIDKFSLSSDTANSNWVNNDKIFFIGLSNDVSPQNDALSITIKWVNTFKEEVSSTLATINLFYRSIYKTGEDIESKILETMEIPVMWIQERIKDSGANTAVYSHKVNIFINNRIIN